MNGVAVCVSHASICHWNLQRERRRPQYVEESSFCRRRRRRCGFSSSSSAHFGVAADFCSRYASRQHLQLKCDFRFAAAAAAYNTSTVCSSSSMRFWNCDKWRPRIATITPHAQAQQDQQQQQNESDESSSSYNSRRQTIVEIAAEELQQEFEFDGAGSASSTKELESIGDWEKVPTLPRDLEVSKDRHPFDPHKPNFSHLLPEALRPYPSFEGWFVRISDPSNALSVALIMATNYATDESQITLLFSPAPSADHQGNKHAKDDRTFVKSGYTYAVVVRTKDARFVEVETEEDWDQEDLGLEPRGFHWIANGVGSLKAKPHSIDLDFTVEGYHFKAHLTKEVLWDLHKSEKGPEGWARFVPFIPTHWYVYSLGSTVEYSFQNLEKGVDNQGLAWGHVEKNWGQTFPAGHVWLQAISADNTSQVVCSGASFKTPGGKLESPHIFVLGYRSPSHKLDFRTNDLGTLFKDIHFAPQQSRFSVTAVGATHSIEVSAYAPFETFSDAVLAPMSKVDWKPACRESFLATVEIKVYEHLAWGVAGQKLVEQQTFENAALEFGEDLLFSTTNNKEGQDGEGENLLSTTNNNKGQDGEGEN